MDIVKASEGGKLTITVTGRLDTVPTPRLERELALEGVTELLFDIAGVEYVSSAGLRLFLMAQKTMAKQGSMAIRGARPVVREVFDITGFSGILTLI